MELNAAGGHFGLKTVKERKKCKRDREEAQRKTQEAEATDAWIESGSMNHTESSDHSNTNNAVAKKKGKKRRNIGADNQAINDSTSPTVGKSRKNRSNNGANISNQNACYTGGFNQECVRFIDPSRSIARSDAMVEFENGICFAAVLAMSIFSIY